MLAHQDDLSPLIRRFVRFRLGGRKLDPSPLTNAYALTRIVPRHVLQLPLLDQVPELKVVMEHITTKDAVSGPYLRVEGWWWWCGL